MEPNEFLPETLAAQINGFRDPYGSGGPAHRRLFCTRKEWEAALADARACGDDVLTILLLYQDLHGHVLEGEDQI